MPQIPENPSTTRRWLAAYPSHVGAEPRPLPFDNLVQMARASVARFPDQVAYTMVLPNGMEASLKFAEVERQSDAFAAYLQSIGVKRGDRVAISLPNVLAYPVCALGVFKLGAVVVNSNPLYTERELGAQLRDSGATVLVGFDKFTPVLERATAGSDVRQLVLCSVADFFPMLTGLVIRTKLRMSGDAPPAPKGSTTLGAALKLGRAKLGAAAFAAPTDLGRGDLALLQYTGGTTGVSKGAMLTHGNLLSNMAQIAEITRGCLEDGRDVVLTVLPLYHVFAFTINNLYAFHCGFRNVLVPNPRPLTNLRPAFKHGITWTTGVNTLLKGLVAQPWLAADARGLKVVYAGGMEVFPAVREAWEQLTGSVVIEGYGLSESSPLVTFNPMAPTEKGVRRTMREVGGVGLPLPATEMRVVGEDGAPLAPGEQGEIVVRGPQVMLGYWKQPEETARVLRDGWLRTGDIGVMEPSGYVRISDRKKDMIVVSGFKVFPNEVEACIAELPQVAEVAVVGIPDENTGEAVRAFVVPKNPTLTPEEIIAHCKQQLTHYKLPRSIAFMAELPKSPVGKTLRRELRAHAT